MKPSKLFFYLVVCSVIGAFLFAPLMRVGASALYQITSTVTATFIPPSATPTVSNFGCPQGTPAGWGTYTPSPLWMVQCSNCSIVTTPSLTMTPSPFPTWNGTGTPYTSTPTETVTPTKTLTVTPTFVGVSLTCGGSPPTGTTCTQINSSTIVYTGSAYRLGGSISFTYFLASASQTYVKMHTGINDFVYLHGDYNGSLGVDWYRWNNVNNYTGFMEHVANGWDRKVAGDHYFNWNDTFGSYSTQRYWKLVGTGGAISKWHYFNSSEGSTFTATGEGYVVISAVPIVSTPTPNPTSTVTVTPTPYLDVGYCSSVAPMVSDFGFDLFVPDGSPNCDMGWNEFGVGDYIIPAVQICFQPSKFGVIRMFSNDYEVGIFGLAAAAAFLWRFFRTV